MGVDTKTFLADLKERYDFAVRDQLGKMPILRNLFGDGTNSLEKTTDMGGRGFTLAVRLSRNKNIGFRQEGFGGVGVAGNQGLANAKVYAKYLYAPVGITGQAEAFSKDRESAFQQGKLLEMKYTTADLAYREDLQFGAGIGNGYVAVVAAAGAGTFTCSIGTGFQGAVFLAVGDKITTGPTAGGAPSIASATITAINYTTGVVTIDAGTATVGDGVYFAGELPAAGAESVSVTPLSMLASDTGMVQGLDPSVAGQENWSAYRFDAGGGAPTISMMDAAIRLTKNKGGGTLSKILVSSAQASQFVAVAAQDRRFVSDTKGGGSKEATDMGFSSFTWNTIPVVESPHLSPSSIYFVGDDALTRFEPLPMALATDGAAEWYRLFDSNGPADAVGALIREYVNYGTRHRSGLGVITGLNVPDQYLGVQAAP